MKTETAINAKILVFVLCVEVIMHLLLHNLHDCTFSFYRNKFQVNYMQPKQATRKS